MQWPAKKPPFRIALVNGYVGNAWRIQMVKTAKAYAKDPAVAPLIKEFKVVSTGTDIAAQLGAIEDFINQGYDGIVTLAVSPEGFDRVIKLADKKGVVIVPFDNVLDTDKGCGERGPARWWQWAIRGQGLGGFIGRLALGLHFRHARP
jgi:ribose transport system substrate-binding protein